MHTFHMPVMGIGFSVDTAVKVAHLGVSSVISLIDDILIERMRALYCERIGTPYQEITTRMKDFRARRITAYLNLVSDIVHQKFEEVKQSAYTAKSDFERYFTLLPDTSPLKSRYFQLCSDIQNRASHLEWLLQHMQPGSIDVNIMTKLDRQNSSKGEVLPVAFNDAHAALRGFADSKINAAVVLSAGLNPRLFSYFENFEDFYPDETGECKKKIILKVSDFRSATIQGKMFAKKGLWISEFRIESGLNCGGHAFPTQGMVMGPVLDEFRKHRESMAAENFELYAKALKAQNRTVPEQVPTTKVTFQGGVGTNAEHQFLLDHFSLDSIGWGSPFMLVPEVVNIDKETLALLCDATSDELFLSDISPLGIPFNSLRNNTKDIEKQKWIDEGHPGSICTKRYGAIGAAGQCTASRAFQSKGIQALDELDLSPAEYAKAKEKITNKACICVGLGTSALLVNDMSVKRDGPAVSVCPGPNLAFFSKEASFDEMVDHIYGRKQLLNDLVRPHLFVNELNLYFDYLIKALDKAPKPLAKADHAYYHTFKVNLLAGVSFYETLSETQPGVLDEMNMQLLSELKTNLLAINTIAMAAQEPLL